MKEICREHDINNIYPIVSKWSRKFLNIMNGQNIPIPGSFESLNFPFINAAYTEILKAHGCKAIDIFGKEFIMTQANVDETIKMLVPIIVDLKEKNPEINIEDVLLYSDLRFCVLYDSIKPNRARKVLLDFPCDIFKFLVENEYDIDILNSLIMTRFKISYNAVEIFKQILKRAKNFESKKQLIGADDNYSLVDYISKRYNQISYLTILSEIDNISKVPIDNERLKEIYKDNINSLTLFSRIYNGMNFNEAYEIGLNERDKYKYTNSDEGKDLREVFYRVIREQINLDRV